MGVWPVAGRDAELDAGAAAWADPRTQGLFVFGAAGVGKSRLAEALLARAAAAGWATSRVVVTEAAVPLGPLAELIPADVDMSDPVTGFAAVVRRLGGADGRRVVLVDDLHLLDTASTVVLRQLLDAGVVRLIGTVRTGTPMSDAVNALTAGGSAHRMFLTEFDVSQVDQVLQAALGAPVGRQTVRELHAASGGNARYLYELVRGAMATGTLSSDGEIWALTPDELPVTPRLAELISTRMAGTTVPAMLVLELLALCEPLSLDDTRSVADGTVLTGLERAGIIQVTIDRRQTTVTLAHPLYGKVLRAGLSAARRRELLSAQAERAERAGADMLRLAAWSLAATGTADPALLMSAATVARNAHDYRQVDALLTAVPDADRTHDACLIHGHAAMQLGRWPEADRQLATAQELAADDTQAVAATLIRSWNLFWMAVRADEALRITVSAREPLADPAGRRVLAVNEAALRALSGDPVTGLAGLDGGDYGSAWFLAMTAKIAGLAYVGRAEEAIALGERVLATGTAPVALRNPMIVAYTDAGRLADARQNTDRLFEDAARTDAALTWTWAACFRGRLEWLAGDAAAARRWYAEALAQARVHGYLGSLFEARAGLAAAAAALGDIAAADAALAAMRDCPPLGHLAGEEDLGAAWLCAARGDLGPARAVLTAAAARARATGHVSSEMVLLTDVARLGGAREVAGRLAELARSCDGTFAPARAHLAAALAAGEPERLLCAADESGAIGANLLAAELSSAAAAAWRRTGQPRRANAATHQAREYAALCPGVATPLLTACDTRTSTATLSSREREIALLAAAGTPSKDIAGTLHLSVRTVDNHLQRVYTKLGVSGRHELDTAIHSGLVN